ncbi:MAG: hypothetical protein H8D82_00080 [Euryarchaeota archaeon]|nr:hypothetical protein [Euryarchaeota archaeon]
MNDEKKWLRRQQGFGDAPAREERFEIAGKALAKARIRNRDLSHNGSSCPILVEGRKDVRALRKLGFSGPIELLNRGWDRNRLVAYLFETYGRINPIDGGPALIILMDWDRTGGRIQNEISTRLRALDVVLDEETRLELIKVMTPEGKTVESLSPFARDLLKEISIHDPFESEEEE